MIQRKPLRDDVQKEILARLIDQRLAPGSRVNESHLSVELGVSRTPLREAMLGLEAAGFLGSDVGRGFLIPPLVAAPFLEGQQVLARLAPLALALTPPVPHRLMDLQNLLGPGPPAAGRGAGRARRRPGARCRSAGRRCCWRVARTGRWQRDIARLEALAVRGWREALRRGYDPTAQLASWNAIYEQVRAGQREAAAAAWGRHLEQFGVAAARVPAGVAAAADSADG